MKNKIGGLFGAVLLLAPAGAVAQQPEVRQACGAEIQQYCAGVEPGDGRVRRCVEEHFSQFSEVCKQALLSNVDVVKACRTDVQRTCSGVEPGGGRIQTCMKDHVAEYTEPCKRAIATAKFGNR